MPADHAVDLVHSDEVPKCLNVSKLLLVNCLNCLKLFGSYRKIRSLIVWQVLSDYLIFKLEVKFFNIIFHNVYKCFYGLCCTYLHHVVDIEAKMEK